MFNPKISLYSGVKDTTGIITNCRKAFEAILSDEMNRSITKLRAEPDDKKRAALKVKLPAVTWSGTFTNGRTGDKLLQHSGLICLDFDKLENVDDVRDNILANRPEFLYAVFISPSGNGLKVICRVEILSDLSVPGISVLHGKHFRQLADYFKKNQSIVADESGKDVNRLCFLSYDARLWVTDQEPTALALPKMEEPKKPAAKKEFRKFMDAEVGSFDYLRKFTDKKFTYAEGSRNQYINAFVMNCKGYGIDEQETGTYVLNNFHEYVNEHGTADVINIVRSVYANTKIEFGKYKPKERKQAERKAQTPKKESVNANTYNEKILFYYEVEKVDKETGEVKTEFKFDHDGLTFFLANNGFRKVRLGEKGFQFVRVSHGLIEAIEPDDINHFIMAYLHKDVRPTMEGGIYGIDDVMDDLHEVRKMYKRGLNTYSKTSMYTSLPELKPVFLKDSEKETFLYFSNGYVCVSGDKKELRSYENLKENIWSKQRKQFDIQILDKSEIEKSVVWQFINMAILGAGSDDGKDPQRLKSMLTTIGYVIDTYKDPTKTKAPVFQDKKVNGTGTDANGGSGKTLTAHMIAKMINTCVIDGKNFSFESPYPYDTFRVDQKLIVYNDVNKKFPFEGLFHKITEDFQFDRRYVDAIVIPHEDSPKHLVITNYSLMGDGSSHRRRQHIIEFSDYFNDEHTPKDEFNHRFFIDWDTAEWNRFYNFMIHCVMLYKKDGLVSFPAQNVKLNKLINEAGEEFIDWMDAMFIGDKDVPAMLPLVKNSKDDLFNALTKDCRRYSQMQNSNKFTNWAKLWADMRGFYLDVNKSGRNYFWTFVDKAKK